MFKTMFHRAAVAFYGFFVPTEDSIGAGMARFQSSLDAAARAADRKVTAEARLRDASYARQNAVARRESKVRAAGVDRLDAAVAMRTRARRVSGRIEQLLA